MPFPVPLQRFEIAQAHGRVTRPQLPVKVFVAGRIEVAVPPERTVKAENATRTKSPGHERKHVEGSVEADEVRLAGSMKGDVSAGSVAILESAKMTGDITQKSLAMEPGAAFNGQVRMRK